MSEAAQLYVGEAEVLESVPSSCSQRWSSPLVTQALPALCYQPWLTNGWQMRLAGWREEHLAILCLFSHRLNADVVQLGERRSYGCDFLSSSFFFLLFFSSSCFYSGKEGLVLHLIIPPLQHVCPSLLLSEVEGVVLSFWSERAASMWICHAQELVPQLWPRLWCAPSAEPTPVFKMPL